MAKGQELPFKSTLDDSDFEAKMRRMQASGERVAAKVGGGLKGLAAPILALGPAIAATFAGGAIVSGVRQVFDAAEALGDLSDQTGVSVGRLAVLGKAFGNAGLQAEDVGTAINRMQKFLVGIGETGEEGGALGKLGLSAKTLATLRPEQQFIAIGKAIAGLRTPAERVNTAMQLFGRSGGRLLAAFNDPLFAAAGGPLTGKAALLERNAEKFAEISIKLNRAGGVLKTFYAGVAERVAGPLDSILDRVVKVDLVGIGQKFGDALVAGAKAFGPMLERVEQIDWGKIAATLGGVASNVGTTLSNVGKQTPDILNNDPKIWGGLQKWFNGVGAFQRGVLGIIEVAGEALGVVQGQELERGPIAATAALPAASAPDHITVTERKGTLLDFGSSDLADAAGRSFTGARDADQFGGNAFEFGPGRFRLSGGGLAGGGLGGGAYGQTGNIWSQISGRVSNGDPMKEIAKHAEATAKNTKALADGLGTRAGGGGGGATVTK